MCRNLAAVSVSLLVHALLFLWLWRAEVPPAQPTAPERTPLVFEVVERAAPPPPAPMPPPRPAAPPGLATKPSRAAEPPGRTGPRPAPSAPPLASDVPRAPREPDLRPRLGWAPPPEGSAPHSRGHTLRPGDPSLSEEVQREEERARVQARLERFGDEAFAAARARGGAPHPYLVQVRDALQAGLKDAGPRTAEGLGYGKGLQPLLQQLTQNYQASAEQFGRTGNPGTAVPSAPTQDEKLRELHPDADFLRGLVQARETRESVLGRAPLLAVSLELTQGRDGALLNAAIVESSGNRLFDTLVLQVVPAALDTAGAPPAEAFRREHLRSLWRIEGRLELTPQGRSALASLLPDLNGLPTGALVQHLEGLEPRLSYGARLLRYY